MCITLIGSRMIPTTTIYDESGYNDLTCRAELSAICTAMSYSKQTTPLQQDEQQHAAGTEAQTNPELYRHFASLVSPLPSFEGFISNGELYRHDQGWHANLMALVGAMVADACFAARPSDIIIATLPKSGTTWIKSLLYATLHREQHPPGDTHHNHPFNSKGPHECIKFLEHQVYVQNRIPNLGDLHDPRLFATHVPHVSLPRPIVASGSKIVYVCRDPKDVLVSLWHFRNKLRVRDGLKPISVGAAVDSFCDGLLSSFGPYWDHVLGYWCAHLAHPERVLFFRYEEMQRDPAAHVRRLAEFVGVPFSAAEEEKGVVDSVVNLCSFEHMSGLDVTKSGETDFKLTRVPNTSFFRQGTVGDWVNHLSSEMARRIDAITQDKFKGTGLRF